MRRTVTITASLAASLIVAAPANADTAAVIKTPLVTLSRDMHGILVDTTYQIAPGSAAKIVYTIKRHRAAGAGFKTVGHVAHIVGSGDGADHAAIRWHTIGGLFMDVGYRVHPRIVTTTGQQDTAHAAKFMPF